MEYVYAAMLLHSAEKTINEENLTEIIKAAGIEADPMRVKALVASLAEVDIDEAIKTTTLAVPTNVTTQPVTEETDEKKEEAKEEEKEEEAIAGLGALFG
jgi:large subunit ribosomal protein L12